MPQLNVHVPASSDLLARIEAAAQRLGTTPSALARTVLDVALEPYVQAQLDRRRQEQAYSSQVVAALRGRFSGALPARPFTAPEGPAEEPSYEATGGASETGAEESMQPGEASVAAHVRRAQVAASPR